MQVKKIQAKYDNFRDYCRRTRRPDVGAGRDPGVYAADRRTRLGQNRWAAAKARAKANYENLVLETKDGVLLACTYYPGVESKERYPSF